MARLRVAGLRRRYTDDPGAVALEIAELDRAIRLNATSQLLPLSRGMQKNVHGTYVENLPALATYLPTSPSTAKSRTQRRRGGRGGSPISRPVLFLLRTCADVRFSVQMPPKPAGDLKIFRARAREPPQRAARTAAKPFKCHKTAAFGCRWPQNRGVPIFFGNIFAGAGLPTYLPWCFLSCF